MSEFQLSKAFYLDFCKHFPGGGTLNETCRVGVKFNDVRQEKQLPCIISDGCSNACTKFEPRTEKEAVTYAIQVSAATKKFFERLANNQCPHCGVTVEKKVQMGRCVYARPCGHRMYQGRA